MRLLQRWKNSLAFILVACLGLTAPVSAAPEGEDVDVAIIFAVDISYSMDVEEQKLQKQGYVEALKSQEVLHAISQGMTGKIAIAYFEWADAMDQRMVLNWTIIDGRATADRATGQIDESPLRRARRTSISGALRFGHKLMEQLPFRAARRVIDVSGDGPNNAGDGVERARDAVLADGIVINGLPVVLKRQYGGWGDIDNLDEYYRDCVVGGPGSFVIPIRTMDQFLSATRQKIIREIAGLDEPLVIPAQARSPRKAPPKADCMIGERMVRDRWGN
jgi:hypothetical protein